MGNGKSDPYPKQWKGQLPDLVGRRDLHDKLVLVYDKTLIFVTLISTTKIF